ncbi:hypothetical protein KJ848_02180, partial [Patescibacteria group bacterium]|nr:hypothetical protein [Patescibacteria group bacterium]
LIGGTGVVSASGSATPGDLLYPVRLKVKEPVQLALTQSPEEKTGLEVAFAGERLKEFASASSGGKLNTDTVALITDSLSEHLANAQDGIQELHEDGDTEIAIQTNADLHSLLSANQSILKKVGDVYPEAASDIAVLSARVDEATLEAADTADTLETSIEASEVDGGAVDAQQEETTASLSSLREQIKNGLAALNEEDQKSVAEALLLVETLMSQGIAVEEAGDRTQAFILYTEADAQLSSLRTLLTADQTLGIDLIDATSTPSF